MPTLVEKYNVPVPRYTSYPTVPEWQDGPLGQSVWENAVKCVFRESNNEKGISIYIHLPYCEKLCHYCACTKIITRNHKVEYPYITALKNEWDRYKALFDGPPVVREFHLGGGTPTFFSPENLKAVLGYILDGAIIPENHEYSFEGHPNTTALGHLQVLGELGFNRMSLGVQDFSPKVQEAINRVQAYETVKEITRQARRLGYQSINYDLIFGLPYQDLACIDNTIEKIEELRPGRLAFYSYAHVPWKEKSQSVFSDEDIPSGDAKRALYERGRAGFERLGYREVGMDHFALPEDGLYAALQEKRLHRNFMGFNTSRTELLVGLGMSAISDAKYAYAQNAKSVRDYAGLVNRGEFAHIRGYSLSATDVAVRRQILDLMCHYELPWDKNAQAVHPPEIHQDLEGFRKDGLLIYEDGKIRVTETGKAFIRNISAAFDHYLRAKKARNTQQFSKSI